MAVALSEKAAPSPRLPWLDIARGLGIILVVFGHVERGLARSGVLGGPFWAGADFIIYTFHMPLFFLLAGLNSPISLARKHGKAFLTEKLWTVVYPYLLWSFAQIALQIAFAGQTNGAVQWSDLMQIGWRPVSPFWFLYALMICHVCFVLIDARPYLLASAGAAALLASDALSGDGIVRSTLHGFAFYALGALLCARRAWRPPNPALIAAVLWLAFGAAAALALTFSENDYRGLASAPAAILGIAAIWTTSWSLRGAAAAVFSFIGAASMTIYVTHVIAAAAARALLTAMGAAPFAALYVSVGLLAGLGAPLAFHILAERWRLLPWLGLATPARAAPERA